LATDRWGEGRRNNAFLELFDDHLPMYSLSVFEKVIEMHALLTLQEAAAVLVWKSTDMTRTANFFLCLLDLTF
jgi:hypothetical protein